MAPSLCAVGTSCKCLPFNFFDLFVMPDFVRQPEEECGWRVHLAKARCKALGYYAMHIEERASGQVSR